MNALGDIPVRVEGAMPVAPADDAAGGLGGGVIAILYEILALAERLYETGEAGAIDLRSMPMISGDRERLRSALGEGELAAVLESGGVSHIRETATRGVWWIEHRNPDDEIVADMIEVTTVPELLVSQRQDVRVGSQRLRQRLAEQTASADTSGK